jgi:hypothetical protein
MQPAGDPTSENQNISLPSGPGWSYFVISRDGDKVNIGLRVDKSAVDVFEKVFDVTKMAGAEPVEGQQRENVIRVLRAKPATYPGATARPGAATPREKLPIFYILGNMVYKHISSEGVGADPLAECMHFIQHTFSDAMYMLQISSTDYTLYEVRGMNECTGDSSTCEHCRGCDECGMLIDDDKKDGSK